MYEKNLYKIYFELKLLLLESPTYKIFALEKLQKDTFFTGDPFLL